MKKVVMFFLKSKKKNNRVWFVSSMQLTKFFGKKIDKCLFSGEVFLGCYLATYYIL